MSFHPANHLPGCMMPDGGDCCAGHAAVVDDWHRQRREIERLRHPAQATLWPDIKQLHDAIAECIGREGLTYSGIRRAAKRVQELYAATIAARPAAAPVDQERLAELQNEAGMYKSLYENAIAQRSSAGSAELADWSRLPRDLYVTSVKSSDGIVYDVQCCSVPMAIGPEVRYTQAAAEPQTPSNREGGK
jgi:hypothetical protein